MPNPSTVQMDLDFDGSDRRHLHVSIPRDVYDDLQRWKKKKGMTSSEITALALELQLLRFDMEEADAS